MSDQLPTKEQATQAYSYMLDEIHAPAFFEKLAANGLEPRNEAEAKQLLQLGAILGQQETTTAEKTAKDGNPFLSHVLDKLDPAGNHSGPVQYDARIKQGSDELIRTSDTAKTAALIYAHAANGGELAPDTPAVEATPSDK